MHYGNDLIQPMPTPECNQQHHINTDLCHEICPTCDAHVQDEGIICDVCNQWWHYQCENLSKAEIREAEEESKEYTCRSCAMININVQSPCQTNPNAYANEATANQSQALPSIQHPKNSTNQKFQLPTNAPPHHPNPHFNNAMSTPPISPDVINQTPQTTPLRIPHRELFHQPTHVQLFQPTSRHGETNPSALNTPHAINSSPQITPPCPKYSNTSQDQHQIVNLQHQVTQLRIELDQITAENENARKKNAAREKQLKARENAVTLRGANQHEREEQFVMLKSHVNNLELAVTDLKEQNKLLKIKLLASEDLRCDENVKSSANPTPAPAHTDSFQQQFTAILNLLQLSALASLAPPKHHHSSSPHITNVYQQQRPHRHLHQRQNQIPRSSRLPNNKQNYVFEYSHSNNPKIVRADEPHYQKHDTVNTNRNEETYIDLTVDDAAEPQAVCSPHASSAILCSISSRPNEQVKVKVDHTLDAQASRLLVHTPNPCNDNSRQRVQTQAVNDNLPIAKTQGLSPATTVMALPPASTVNCQPTKHQNNDPPCCPDTAETHLPTSTHHFLEVAQPKKAPDRIL